LSSLNEQDRRSTRVEERARWRHTKVGEEKESPREDWPARRPSGQLLYASKYDTGVLLNHKER
jgi:hypothetical protein